MSLIGRKWTIGNYDKPYEAFTDFTVFTDAERRGKSGFRFEKTYLQWHFGVIWVDGLEYCNAWADGQRNLLVPMGQTWYIGSTSEDKRLWEKEKKETEALEKRIALVEAEKYRREAIRQMFAELASPSVSNPPSSSWMTQEQAVDQKATEVIQRFGEEILTLGGRDLKRQYESGQISESSYFGRLQQDLASDIMALGVGATVGSLSGPTLALVGGGTAAAPAVAVGATVAYITNRAVKAAARTYYSVAKGSESSSSSTGPTSSAPRIQATRGDADRYLKGLTDQRVLSAKKIARDGREYYEFTDKCEYQGMKFKKGEFIERDTQHHEWEYFQNKDTHLGAIDPLTGVLNVAKRQRGRTLKLP